MKNSDAFFLGGFTTLILSAIILLLLTGCGGAGSGASVTVNQCPPGAGNVWQDCQLTPASVAAPAAEEAQFKAEFSFAYGDRVVNCFNGTHDTVVEVAWPSDGTVRLATNAWTNTDDLIQDGPPYTCAP